MTFTMVRKQLGKYRIVRELGRGAMGVVYLGVDTTLDRQVALKVLRDGLFDSERDKERFRREARFVAQLRHPNIVRVHAFEEADHSMVIDMEYMEGGTLEAAAREHEYSASAAVGICAAVLSALASAHEHGHLHRDVKPGNILLDANGTPYLSDFGLARIAFEHNDDAKSLTQSSAIVVGTPRYLPPEAWNGAEADPSWDVYAAGLVLYELLTRRPAFQATTTLGLIKEIATTPIPSIGIECPNISTQLITVVDDMVGEHARRPHTAAEALHRLAATPEFKEAGAVKPVKPYSASAPKAGDRVQRAATVFREKRRVAGVLGWVLFAAVTLAWYLRPGASSSPSDIASQPNQPAASVSDRYPSLRRALHDELLTETKALELNRFHDAEPGKVYQVLMTDDHTASFRWWLEHREKSGVRRATLFGERSLAVLTMSERANTVQISGNWATLAAGGNVQKGGLRGEAIGLGNDAMGVQLTLENERGGGRELYLNRAPIDSTKTDTWFYWQLERQEYVQPLLYSHLLPQRVDWAQEIDEALPAVVERRSVVPYAGRHDAPVIDGRTDERIWHDDWVSEEQLEGNVTGMPAKEASRMLLRYRDEGLYVAGQTRWDGAPEQCELSFQLLIDYGDANAAATVIKAATSLLNMQLYTDSRGKPVDNSTIPIESAIRTTNLGIEAELFVSFAKLGLDGPPNPTERWRVHLELVEVLEKNTSNARKVSFGFLPGSSIHHSVVIQFAHPDPEISGLTWRRE